MSDEAKFKLPWIKSSKGVSEIYANVVHPTWTLDDIRLRFGQVVDSPSTPNPGEGFQGATEERAAVTLTWRNAKVLTEQLIQIIGYYEKVNGEINVDITLPSSE